MIHVPMGRCLELGSMTSTFCAAAAVRTRPGWETISCTSMSSYRVTLLSTNDVIEHA